MDLRVEKTYAALIRAFTCLLEEMPYEDITIAQLCDKALIRRTTFYKHFADKNEFFVFYIESLRDEFEERCLSQVDPVSVQEHETRMLNELVRFLLEHEKLVDNVMGSAVSTVLLDALGDVIRRDIEQAIIRDPSVSKGLQVPAASLAAFISGGILSLLKRWLATNRDPRDVGEIETILQGLSFLE